MQSTFFYSLRSKFCQWLNAVTKSTYTKYFKSTQNSWNMTLKDLSYFNKNSLGEQLKNFLTEEGFSLMAKHESHDVFHILGQFNTSIEDEIAMQCFLFANGKRTLYMALSILIGIIIPEFLKSYSDSFKRGKKAFPIHQLNFKPLLNYPSEYIIWLFSIPTRYTNS